VNQPTPTAVAIGPRMPGWGSWEWLGADLAAALRGRFEVREFDGADVPACDAVVVVKHALPVEVVEALSRRARVVYAPVDHCGSVADIDAAHPMLRRCSRIVVHSERLRRCFAPYTRVEYVDHHVKFVTGEPVDVPDDGEVLWVGVRTNVPYLGEWLRRHPLPCPLRVLTNFENPGSPPSATELGLGGVPDVVLEHWTPETHLRRLGGARGALDVKGFDFRQWHKPPAKALDFVAAGLPLAMNRESSAVEHLRERYGFDVPTPLETDRWFSRAYRDETLELAVRLRGELSLERIALRWAGIVEEVLDEPLRRRPGSAVPPTGPPASAAAIAFRPTPAPVAPPREAARVEVVSLLFEWPTRGGGNVHTYELVGALSRAGHEVRHLVVRYRGWSTGEIREPLPYDHEVLDFTDDEWSLPNLRQRVREAVDRFDPDAVILTDSWNAKPVLAETLAGYPTILRLQALECVCPLNNVRLLPGLEQCDGNQLADPGRCRRCLVEHAESSGGLHRVERRLCGVGSEAYDAVLQRAFERAAAVLVVNHATEQLVAPHARRVIVAPSGFDGDRFPWPPPDGERRGGDEPLRILFAGHPTEPIKGFDVLRAACDRLRRTRRDFRLVVTSDAPSVHRPYEEYVGWRGQGELPPLLRSADVVVVPSIAQEALGRVAVEAMGVGRPVVASRIGGLPTTVVDGGTGLLFEPGNADDLAEKLARLLDDPDLRNRLGRAGRDRFESEYTWGTLVERCYDPLLADCRRRKRGTTGEPRLGCVLAVRDRDPAVLGTTLDTYDHQTRTAVDRILVDYGSDPEFAAEYARLATRHGWRLLRVEAEAWSLPDAYDRGVEALDPAVDVVFKSDADVLLDADVLAVAGERGREALCLFACHTTGPGTPIPDSSATTADFDRLFTTTDPSPMEGEGLVAFPRAWFERIGGFDRRFTGWGYEDSDLRRRASLTIGVTRPHGPRLLHRWHPRNVDHAAAERNRRLYESTKAGGPLVRNRADEGDVPIPRNGVVVATRSLSDELYALSGRFLRFDDVGWSPIPSPTARHRLRGHSAVDYLLALADLPARWVVNLDEDAFLLDPGGLLRLIERMDLEGHAACGMPDGGVVPIRRHSPAVPNAFFNVLDLDRVRPVWSRPMARETPFRPEYAADLPDFARRTEFACDDFEPYYGLFHALRAAGESILPLDAETWTDGVSTVLRGIDGEPLLVHAWYAREWTTDPATRRRYEEVVAFAEEERSGTRRSRAGSPRIART
jgi:glycosyltransferase involved in cell wall biosynthesis